MTSVLTLRILRLSLAFVFFWFGIAQLVDPGSWVGFLPEATGYFPIPGEMMVQWNGWMEVVGAGLLLFGLHTRLVSALLGVHLLAIAYVAGGAIGVRDFGLGMMALALAASSVDTWTMDAYFSHE